MDKKKTVAKSKNLAWKQTKKKKMKTKYPFGESGGHPKVISFLMKKNQSVVECVFNPRLFTPQIFDILNPSNSKDVSGTSSIRSERRN